jgi:hypothetical protein
MDQAHRACIKSIERSDPVFLEIPYNKCIKLHAIKTLFVGSSILLYNNRGSMNE